MVKSASTRRYFIYPVTSDLYDELPTIPTHKTKSATRTFQDVLKWGKRLIVGRLMVSWGIDMERFPLAERQQ